MKEFDSYLCLVGFDDVALLPKPILVWGFSHFAKEMLESGSGASRHIECIFDKNPQADVFRSIGISPPPEIEEDAQVDYHRVYNCQL